MSYDKCPKCGNMTLERYPKNDSLGECLNRKCCYKEKLEDKTHCVVCFGEVVENRKPIFSKIVGGEHKEVDGYYCTKCGLRYQFKPDYKKVR